MSAMTPAENIKNRILIVEDDADTASSMAELLKMMGCETVIARDGSQAIQKAIRFRPRIVLLDIGLPGMNGYDVAQVLRSTPEVSTVLIVAISGYGEPEDKRNAYSVGIDLHVTKPVQVSILKELVSVYAS
jgi:CheY-like chemotaxis protein